MSLISPKKAAEELNVSPKTLRKIVKAGLIVYVVTGLGEKRPGISFDPVEIERFKVERSRRECPSVSVPKAPTISMSSRSMDESFGVPLALRAKPKRKR
jgi:hypothetical protein